MDVRSFVPPDDGVWCARLNGHELSCQGDTHDSLDAQFTFEPPGPPPWTLTATAVLRAGLGGPASLPVVRESAPFRLVADLVA